MKPLLLIAILTVCIANPCGAQQIRQETHTTEVSLDGIVRAQMAANKIPGVSLAIVYRGKIAALQSYGLANVEHQVPIKPETIFQSGSMGKQFTAAAVMLLVQENKLSLTDKISKYFPDAPVSWKDITVWNLLTHTSGLGDYPPDIDLKRDYTEAEYYASFKKAPLDFAPGTSWNYSNVGYVVLGMLIGKVTGKFYGEFFQERIFQPLGMTTARVISEADIVPNRAAGYRLVNGELKNQEWVSPSTNSTADGSLYLSILDLAKWDAALYTNQLLTHASRIQMWTPAKLRDGTTRDYGFGWHIGRSHGRRFVFHGGAWQGFKTFIMRFLDRDMTIIFLANSWETRDFKFARTLAAALYPEFALPAVNTIADTDPKTTALIRRVLMLSLTGGDKELARSLSNFSLPAAIIHSSELIEHKTENNLRVYRYLLTDIGRSAICTVKLTSDDKITSIELEDL